MPGSIDREEVRRLMDRGVPVVEVLAPEEYEEDHLPGAINLTLQGIEERARAVLDPTKPVVVYCWDSA
jgi:rhodanese-related sulfurtransferase